MTGPGVHAENDRAETRLSVASHLALWPGLYIAGAVGCFAQVAGVDGLATARAQGRALAFAFLTAAGVYILDRVKLRDAWLDPADAAAHPARFAFIARRPFVLRAIVAALLLSATLLGLDLFTGAALLPVLAAIGVALYAGRPRSVHPRPKDILIFKNALVGVGIAAFSAVISVGGSGREIAGMQALALDRWPALAISCLHLAVRVFADAALCDLDDEHADRRFGTATLPVRLGRTSAWNAAMALRIMASLSLLPIPVLPLSARLAWGAVTVISSTATRLASPGRLRDWVDARFALEALAVTLILGLARA